MAIAKKVRYNKEEEFARLKMGRLTGEDAAEAYMAKMLVNFTSHKSRSNFYRAGPKPWGGISRGIQTKHFSALCKYISRIKDENEDERVAWLESKNIPGLDGRKLNEADAQKAAYWMGATASLNRSTSKRAAIHYIISFPPDDTRRLHDSVFKDTVDKGLDIIGANEHQALTACHIDRDHRHLHIVLNRIHPVTEKPLNSFRDLVKLEKLMRDIEQKHFLKPVQGRHFDLNGRPLLPGDPRPQRRPNRTTALGLMRKQLNNENIFRKAQNWEELHQYCRDNNVQIIDAGSRLELSFKEKNLQVPAGDLFRNEGSLRKLERKFGESYSSWNKNQKETQEATRLGLTLQAFQELDDERRVKEKDVARKSMLKINKDRVDALRRITEKPIRISQRHDLYPECSELYGPAFNERTAEKVLTVLKADEVKDWLDQTKKAVQMLEKTISDIEKEPKASLPDDKDALLQMKDGVRLVQSYAERKGIIPKARRVQKPEIEAHSYSKQPRKPEKSI